MLVEYLIAFTAAGCIILFAVAFVFFVAGGIVDACNGVDYYIHSAGPIGLAGLCVGLVSLALHYFLPFTRHKP